MPVVPVLGAISDEIRYRRDNVLTDVRRAIGGTKQWYNRQNCHVTFMSKAAMRERE